MNTYRLVYVDGYSSTFLADDIKTSIINDEYNTHWAITINNKIIDRIEVSTVAELYINDKCIMLGKELQDG